ncbi:hypothetical protein L6164_029427 [Bauhinia variegata]|uniref:Uncharacterized protein n=1 Tax=Bauhinia variegata TaxID=167791 RepID=A0ACB9L9C2_BAUVA|nr:hypothetical protein L6164_029427 [Bauhinia variegata]
MSSSPLPVLIFILAFLSSCFSGDASSKCENFPKFKSCKELRSPGAVFAYNYQNNTNTTQLEILFGAPLRPPHTSGWIAWGVNPGKRPEMIGTQAIVGIINERGSPTSNTFDITKETRLGCLLLPTKNLSGLQVLNASVAYDGKERLYTISATLVLENSVYNISRLNHVWQVGYAVENGSPRNHPTTLRNIDSTETVDLTTNEVRGSKNYRSYLRSVHGVLNIVGWGTFLPIGVIAARYLRVYPIKWEGWWAYIHMGCQTIGYLTGTTGWVIGLWLGHVSKYHTFYTHRTFAIFIFAFTTLQMLAFRLRPKPTDDYRKYWNMYHHLLGYALLVVICLNIFKGISILQGGEGWRWSYIAILAFLGAITLFFEAYTWFKFMGCSKNCAGRRQNQVPPSPAQGKPAAEEKE